MKFIRVKTEFINQWVIDFGKKQFSIGIMDIKKQQEIISAYGSYDNFMEAEHKKHCKDPNCKL